MTTATQGRQLTAGMVVGSARPMAVSVVLVTGLASAALWLWAAPPEGQVAVGRTAAVVCLVGAVLVGLLAWLAGRPGASRTAGGPGTPVVLGTACALAVEAIRVSTGLLGPWTQQELLAVTVVAAAALWLGARATGVATLFFVSLLVAPALLSSTDRSLTLTAVAAEVAGVRLGIVGLGVAALVAGAERLARASDAAVSARAKALIGLEAARAAAAVTGETQRSLHDTALNTLEAVARSGAGAGAITARCRRDIDVLTAGMSRSVGRGIEAALAAVVAESDGLGVSVVLVVDPAAALPPVPAYVVEAITGAVREAITNVSKHAGVPEARITVRTLDAGVEVAVSDRGVGLAAEQHEAPGRPGFGVAQSVVRRMSDVGGRASVAAADSGEGTRVTLTWSPAAPPDVAVTAAEFRATASTLVLVAAWALTAVSLVTVALGAASYTRPLVAVVGVLLPALWLTVLARRVRAGHDLQPLDLVTSGLVLLAASLLPTASDPYCSSIVGELGLPDARLLLVVALLLWSPARSTWLAATAAMAVATLATAWAWNGQWPDCGQQTLAIGLAQVVLVALVWAGVSALQREARVLASLERDELAASLELERESARSAARRRWSDSVVRPAVAELSRIVAAGGVADQESRNRADSLAGLLRALLSVGPSPDPLHAALRGWLGELMSRPGSAVVTTVSIRGALSALTPPDAVAHSVRTSLRDLARCVPDEVVLLGWSDSRGQGLSCRARSQSAQWLPAPMEQPTWRCEPNVDDDLVTADATWTWSDGEGDTTGGARMRRSDGAPS